MVRVRFSETIEIGNHKTGLYRRWEKKAEFEGSGQEVSYLINSISSTLKLPGVSSRFNGNDNFMIDGFKKMLLLDE